MRTFNPSKKGVIKVLDKEYKIKTDSMTQTILASDSIPKLASVKAESEQLQADHSEGKVSDESYIEQAYLLVDKLEELSRRFCIRSLGRVSFEEIERVSNGLDFDDLNNLTTLIMLELTDIKNAENVEILKGLDHYG